MDFIKLIKRCNSFEWDKGNEDKNWVKHKVKSKDCEEIFINNPSYIDDEVHSGAEKRYGVLGETNEGRKLTLFITLRNNKIRIISARDQSKKERKIYKLNKI